MDFLATQLDSLELIGDEALNVSIGRELDPLRATMNVRPEPRKEAALRRLSPGTFYRSGGSPLLVRRFASMPTALDNGERSPSRLLAADVRKLLASLRS